MSISRGWIPIGAILVANVALLGLIGFTKSRYEGQLRIVTAQRDTVARALKQINTELTRAGDSVPRIGIIDPSRRATDLQTLVRRGGVKYVYFYRGDCPACEVLAPFLGTASQAVNDSLIFVKFHASKNLSPDPRAKHFAWVHSAQERTYIRAIPTLFVVDDRGLVEAVAQGDLSDVAALFDFHGILSKVAVDSFATVVQRKIADQSRW